MNLGDTVRSVTTPRSRGAWAPTEQGCVFDLSELGDIWGCGCRLLPGGVGVAKLCSEDSVPDRDAGELQEPGVAG